MNYDVIRKATVLHVIKSNQYSFYLQCKKYERKPDVTNNDVIMK